LITRDIGFLSADDWTELAPLMLRLVPRMANFFLSTTGRGQPPLAEYAR
jgi:hypothetical protein